MASPKVSIENARASEERYRTSIREAVLGSLGTTPERILWCEAALEILWEYGELSPFEVAAGAWRSGNQDLYERALADDARLTALAEAAKAAEAAK